MTSDITSAVPSMGAETGYELEEQARVPVRISGFLCFGLGLLSALCLLGQPLLMLPIAAVVLGIVALRPAGDQKPVGTLAAQIGLVLAVGFGSCGFFLSWMKAETLGSQASYFARQYLELIAHDQAEMAVELRRDHSSRPLDSTPLKEYYWRNDEIISELEEFRSNGAYQAIRRAGVDAEWQLEHPVRISHKSGRERAEMTWTDAKGSLRNSIRVVLEYDVDSETGDGQWHVVVCELNPETGVAAESVALGPKEGSAKIA